MQYLHRHAVLNLRTVDETTLQPNYPLRSSYLLVLALSFSEQDWRQATSGKFGTPTCKPCWKKYVRGK